MTFFENIDFGPVGIEPGSIFNRGRHIPRHYGIQYNHDGGFFLRKNGQETYRLHGSWAFVTYPGTDYFDYGPLENKPRYHVFVCFIGDVNRYIASGLFPAERDPPMIKINYADRFLKTITEVIDMIRTPCLKHDRTVLMLEDLMLQLHEQEEPCGKASSYLRPAFEKLMSEIRQKIQREWNFDREADSMNLSLIHFRRLFRQFSGLPPQQFLNQCRLQKASELLTGTDFNINEIAEQVGIGNAFYFSRLFKQKLKLSPLAYRKNFRGG